MVTNWNPINRDITQKKYYIDPLTSLLESGNNHKINILQGTTGSGKTHVSLNKMPAMLINLTDVVVHVILSPVTELLSDSELPFSWGSDIHCLIGKDEVDAKKVKRERKRKKLLILACTHGWFFHKKQAEIRDYLLNCIPSKVSYDLMELHRASSSSIEASKANIGVCPDPLAFKGQLHEYIRKALEKGSWAFGSTATLTNEMKKDYIGSDLWNIINDPIPLKEIGGYMKYIDDASIPISPDKEDIDVPSHVASMIKRIRSVEHDLILYVKGKLAEVDRSLLDSDKEKADIYRELLGENNEVDHPGAHPAGLIKVEKKAKKSFKWDIKKIRNILAGQIMEAGDGWENFHWVEVTEKGWTRYATGPDWKSSGPTVVEKSKRPNDNRWLWLMKEDPKCKIVVVVMRGTVGINIPNLTHGLILRSSDMENEGERILNSGLQLLGRFNRQYFGGLTRGQMAKLPVEVQEKIGKELNVFKIAYINTEYWQEVLEEYEKSYGLTYDQARKLYAQ